MRGVSPRERNDEKQRNSRYQGITRRNDSYEIMLVEYLAIYRNARDQAEGYHVCITVHKFEFTYREKKRAGTWKLNVSLVGRGEVFDARE